MLFCSFEILQFCYLFMLIYLSLYTVSVEASDEAKYNAQYQYFDIIKAVSFVIPKI